MINKVLHMDCFDVLDTVKDNSVDLIVIDPPYGIEADKRFGIKWKNNKEFLEFIKNCCKEIHRVLKITGSFYLMIDRVNSHKVKLLLDDIFGKDNFRNEIIWNTQPLNTAGFKTKANNWIYSQIRIFYYVKDIKSQFVFNKEFSQKYENSPIGDVWNDILSFNYVKAAKQSVGVPTQKPIELMKRIIKASSNENDLILDCFCGSGTTAVACKQLGRRFICCDSNKEYVDIANKRLQQEVLF